MPVSLRLPDHIYSREQLLKLDEQLSKLEGKLRNLTAAHKDSRKKSLIDEIVSREFVDLAAQLIDDKLTISTVRSARQRLKEHLDKAKNQTVHIILSHQVQDSDLEDLAHWFRANIKADIFLEITVNPSIVGGIVIRAGSRLYDFSFKKEFEAHKDVLKKAVDNV